MPSTQSTQKTPAKPTPSAKGKAVAGPKRDAALTRQKLIECAERLFAEFGYAGTSIDRIAAESGINKRMIYVYFSDKEGLYKAVLTLNFKRALHFSQSAEKSAEPADVLLRAEELIKHYFSYLGNNPSFVRLLMRENLDGGKHAGKVLVETAAQTLDDLHGIVRTGMRQGLFRQDLDERKLVICINALCLGYFSERALLLALWGEDITSPEVLGAMQRFIVALVMNGIRPRPSEGAHRNANGNPKE